MPPKRGSSRTPQTTPVPMGYTARTLARVYGMPSLAGAQVMPSSVDKNTPDPVPAIKSCVANLAQRNGQPVFVTLAERGIVAALPTRPAEHVPAHPVHGPIDVVGAGDTVTANLAAALAAGAELVEAMRLAMAAASLVIHQLGTTGTATVPQLQQCLTREGTPSSPATE